MAESIAEAILDGFDVEAVTVTVKKPEVPIKGSILSHAAVEIRRARCSRLSQGLATAPRAKI